MPVRVVKVLEARTTSPIIWWPLIRAPMLLEVYDCPLLISDLDESIAP